MGRLSALSLAAGLALLGITGCDQTKRDFAPPPPMTGRSNGVAAKPTASEAARPTASAPTVVSAKPAAPRMLCKGQDLRPAPKGTLSNAVASGGPTLSATIPFGTGKWIWLNLWAAWCAPCKEEIPRILAWKEKLSAAGVLMDVAFVSLDDDARQMRRFLDSQPENGLRATYWLPEGEGRATWLQGLGLKETTQLPVQALVAPSGQLACVIAGAVEDGDYPAVAAFVGAKK